MGCEGGEYARVLLPLQWGENNDVVWQVCITQDQKLPLIFIRPLAEICYFECHAAVS